MAAKRIWVSPDDGDWKVHRADGRDLSHHRLQSTAIESAIRVAKADKTDVVIQGVHGQIRSIDSYGNESPTKDTEN